jgi:hypothetical protein
MQVRVQLLLDLATRVIVYAIEDGPRAQLPDISEDLGYWIYSGEAPDSFSPESALDHILNRDEKLAVRDREYAEEMPRLLLLSAKCNAMWDVFDSITAWRRPYTKNLPFQVEIYKMKEAEARRYRRDLAHATSSSAQTAMPDIKDYPLLRSYSELYKMEPADAADTVIFMAEENKTNLQITEHMRLYWTKRIVDSRSLEEIGRIRNQMIEENFRVW